MKKLGYDPGANHQLVLQQIADAKATVPDQRSQRLQRMPALPYYQELMHLPGVLRFLRELICVADDSDARLLSWFAWRKMRTLVVADWM